MPPLLRRVQSKELKQLIYNISLFFVFKHHLLLQQGNQTLIFIHVRSFSPLTQVAAQSDVCWAVMFCNESSRRQHREAGISKDVVGNEGAQLTQHPPRSRTSPDIKDQRGALVYKVVSPPLASRRVVGLPAWWEGGAAAGRRLVVNAFKFSQKGREALLKQLHIMSLYFSGEERGRG